MTLDGFCDHTSAIADEQLHQHYTDLVNSAGALLYGRITYQLMESYWPNVVKAPTGNKADDDFAVAIERVPKVVFSRTLKSVGWKNVRLAKRDLKEEVLELRQQAGKPIFVGSRSLIVALMKLGLIDEYQICVHPVIGGSALPLFKDITDRTVLRLLRTKTFDSGQIALYYEPIKG
jgi:dihydrofolate reductase